MGHLRELRKEFTAPEASSLRSPLRSACLRVRCFSIVAWTPHRHSHNRESWCGKTSRRRSPGEPWCSRFIGLCVANGLIGMIIILLLAGPRYMVRLQSHSLFRRLKSPRGTADLAGEMRSTWSSPDQASKPVPLVTQPSFRSHTEPALKQIHDWHPQVCTFLGAR